MNDTQAGTQKTVSRASAGWQKGIPEKSGFYWVYRNDNRNPVIFQRETEFDDPRYPNDNYPFDGRVVYEMGNSLPVNDNQSLEPGELEEYLWFGPIEVPPLPKEVNDAPCCDIALPENNDSALGPSVTALHPGFYAVARGQDGKFWRVSLSMMDNLPEGYELVDIPLLNPMYWALPRWRKR